jgi:hypothetical protein
MVVADVQGRLAAMGDGCSEVGWQLARGLCENVRTRRPQPVGRGPMEILRGRVMRTAFRGCGGLGVPSAEDNGATAGCLRAGIGRPRNIHNI